MGKHKKHPSEHCQQKIRQLQHKNEFAKRLKAFATAYMGKEAAALLTHERLEDIYAIRMHTIKMVVADGSVIEPGDRKYVEAFMLNRIKDLKIAAPDGSEVPFSEYLTVGLSLSFYITRTTHHSQTENDPFFKAFAGYKDLFYSGEEACKRLYYLANDICYFINEIGVEHFWIDANLKFKMSDDKTILPYLELHREVPEKHTFIIDNESRHGFRVGWSRPISGVEYIKLKPSELGMNGNSPDTPMDIYIQAHALQRLEERLDCLPKELVHFCMILSLIQPRFTHDGHGKFLFEYWFDKYKPGYLLANIVDGCILIRTFLFLTNSGTPEGQKLEKMTGLGKLDKKYLAIDKLSTFMATDIRPNEAVMKLLHESGCESLVDLIEDVTDIIQNKNFNHHTGAMLSRYLELNKVAEKELLEKLAEM
ncbi:MAG TPA: hypothetical protein VIH57_11665 [Bacteroidales bacterium]